MNKEFAHIAKEIRKLAFKWEENLKDVDEDILVARLNRQGRNIKQIIGHMIDSASNNHQRMVRLQYSSHPVFPDYTSNNDTWISIQQHQEENWDEMLQLWKYFNLHMAHVINHIDESWQDNTWTDGKMDLVSLKDMAYDYLSHLTVHLNEIKVLMQIKEEV